MSVTVLVSGLPDHIPLTDLAHYFDKLFNTDEVGTFRLKEVWNENEKRLVALGFESGFDAMHVHKILDGMRFTNGGNYKIKCKISNDKRHAFALPIEYEDNFVSCHSKYELSTNSITTFNEYKMKKECSSLDTYLTLLQKKKSVIEAERALLKAKRKLKKEHRMQKKYSEDEASSSHLNSKSPEPKDSWSQRSRSRDRQHLRAYPPYYKQLIPVSSSTKLRISPSTSRELVPIYRSYPSPRSKSRSRQPLIKSFSPSKSYLLNFNRSPYRNPFVNMAYYDGHVSSSTLKTSVSRRNIYRSPSSSRRSRSSSRKHLLQLHHRRSPSFGKSSRWSPYNKSASLFRKSPNSRSSYHRTHTSSLGSYNRKSPLYREGKTGTSTRSEKCCNYCKYFKSNDSKYLTNKGTNGQRCNTIREYAIESIIIEVQDLVHNEKKSVSENEISIVTNVFKEHVTSGFMKLKGYISEDMSVKEAVDCYRRYRSIDEDKAFLLKMIQELKSINYRITADKNDDAEKSSNDVWDDIEEVLQDIPIEMLQCSDRKNTSTDQYSGLDNNVIDEVDLNSESKSVNIDFEFSFNVPKNNDSEDFAYKFERNKQVINVSKEGNLDKGNFEETRSNMELPRNNIMQVINVSKEGNLDMDNFEETQSNMELPRNNIMQVINVSKEGNLDKDDFEEIQSNMELPCNNIHDQQTKEATQKTVPKNPAFVIPVKKLMIQMKKQMSKFNSDFKDLHVIIKNILRDRLLNILKGKELMKTAEIITLYRSIYPMDDDEIFLKDVTLKVRNDRTHNNIDASQNKINNEQVIGSLQKTVPKNTTLVNPI